MHKPQRGTDSFIIQVRSTSGATEEEALEDQYLPPRPRNTASPSNKFNLSPMKLFHRFRKILMRLVFSVPSRRSSSDSRHRNSDRFEPPKTSCSSYYSSYSHYNEAIADCIQFFNKSAQEGVLDGRKSDVV